ncbi:unnamed protein product, partial [Ectocarpus sp. 8 AP-2014]
GLEGARGQAGRPQRQPAEPHLAAAERRQPGLADGAQQGGCRRYHSRFAPAPRRFIGWREGGSRRPRRPPPGAGHALPSRRSPLPPLRLHLQRPDGVLHTLGRSLRRQDGRYRWPGRERGKEIAS